MRSLCSSGHRIFAEQLGPNLNKLAAMQIHGMFDVKLATLLMLIGGVARHDTGSGGRVRGEVHMLLVRHAKLSF